MGHLENLRHPGVHPVEGVLAADRPDKDDLADGRGSVVVGFEEIADMG